MKYENDQIIEEDVTDEEGVEIRNEYNEQNRLIYSGPFRQNIPIGIHRYYHPDGEVVDAKIYNNEGKIIAEGDYDSLIKTSEEFQKLAFSGVERDRQRFDETDVFFDSATPIASR